MDNLWEDIESCFSCESVDGSNLDCERINGSRSIFNVPRERCPDEYCFLAIGQSANSVVNGTGNWVKRGCASLSTHVTSEMNDRCAIQKDGSNAEICDFCETNFCNGWTLRQLPDKAVMEANLYDTCDEAVTEANLYDTCEKPYLSMIAIFLTYFV